MRQRLVIILAVVVIAVLLLTIFRGKPKSKISERKTSRLVQKERPVKKTQEVSITKPEDKKETKEQRLEGGPGEKEIKPEVRKEIPVAKPPSALAKEKPEEEWGEDPFVREFSAISEIKDLRLTAITISESRSYALINDQILAVGDEIAGKKVVAIEKDKVVVEKGGRRFTLLLGE